MTQYRGFETAYEKANREAEEKKAADKQAADEKKIADAKEKKAADAKATAKAEKPEPKKEEKAAPVRKTRTTVLRDIVEGLESGEHISDEMRADLQELNRRLTRALAS